MDGSLHAANILSVVKPVTKKWEKQRKAEERGRRTRSSRSEVYAPRTNFTDVAGDILPPAYEVTSGDDHYSVDKRQFYYTARQPFLEATGRPITADYFSQNLLVRYVNQHPEETARWRITADARGTLILPNAGHAISVPVGTIEIQEHLRRTKVDQNWRDMYRGHPCRFPRHGPGAGREPSL